jgi:hypothetical protein
LFLSRDQRPAKAAEMEAHFVEIPLSQISEHRPAVEAELPAAREGLVKDHTGYYGLFACLF